ncbi:DNA polymerase IV [Treponema phagedenis]|uniref:DNA polymerase IV n=1 Tax=Treponema phagedenis TaxID=162 RepID=A0A0B7GWR9_TREPH|nr:DNA polymerase IV [Treponema phagedenis]EFW36891.1 ImpB/MucB/SamB family protein [Treponema phagedenis F0421]NVP23471.1 DNA polymerase IV [Treponema phagedenis]QEJ95237.1 DNA polymerase IV [Treponema phagedenis]QEJ98613.1 DNA polymerase IV [Treponema phagedenis]QEK01091.1 DNA polymerase IV [Treponema phagedenis]
MTIRPLFFHVDLDAFYASVEQLDNPQYQGLPVIIGGQSKRGVVSTCSYEARKYGVHSAMPIMQARKLCPKGIFLPTRMKRYHEVSKAVMAILREFSPAVHQISVDEAFLDMTGTERLFGPAENSGKQLKKAVKEKTGLNISVGAASNKYIAKIASNKSKPDGLLIIPFGAEAAFMAKLKLKDIWGIGSKTRQRLEDAGIYTVEKILKTELKTLQRIIGNSAGSFLAKAVRGDTAHVFNEEVKSRSVSSERTFETDIIGIEAASDVLFFLASEVMYRVLDEKIQSKTVCVKIRYADFTTVSIQETGSPINDAEDLYLRARSIFSKKYLAQQPIRLLGLGVMNVSDAVEEGQLSLFTNEEEVKHRKIEEAMMQINKAKGKTALVRARLIKDNDPTKV